MGANYVICEDSYVKHDYPEYRTTCAVLEAKVKEDAQMHIWPGLDYGGYTPDANQFGRTTIPPWLWADQNSDVLDKNHSPTTWGVNDYRILYTDTYPTAVAIPGWKQIWQGASIPQTLEDFIVALAGFSITSEVIQFTKMHQVIGPKNFPITDIEEVNGYCRPTLIFEEGFRIPPETFYSLTAFFVTSGYQRIVPKGFALYRRQDLVITE